MPAAAGAWVAPEKGQGIWTEFVGERDEITYFETSIYYERPATESVSIVVAPWVTSDTRATELDYARWEVTLAAKTAVLRRPGMVMAVQGGAVWQSDPPNGCAETAAELRWLGGVTFGHADQGFLNLEAAERASEGDCGGERLDLTMGYRPDERWLGMAQVFVDEPRLGDGAVKAQISVVRFWRGGRGLQLGLRARVDGEAAEPALVLGFWAGGS